MRNSLIFLLMTVVLLMTGLSGCDALGAGGNVVLSVGGIILGILLLGWLAIKVLGGVLEIGLWGIVIFVLLIIGFIAFVIIKSLGT